MTPQNTQIPPFPPALFLCCAVTWISTGLLVGLFALMKWVYQTTGIGMWLLQSIPLLIFLPFLLRNIYKAYSGLAMLILVYFVATVPEVMSRGARWYEHVVLALTMVIFLTSMYSSRWLQRWQVHNAID